MNAKARMQDLFTRMVVHTLTQNQQSMTGPSGKLAARCAYRGADGLKCAVGCLIKDEFYDKSLDRPTGDIAGIYTGPVYQALRKSLGFDLTVEELNMMHGCQTVHDCANPSEWRARFAKIGKNLKLKMPKVTA